MNFIVIFGNSDVKRTIKVKVKFALEQAMKARE